jgi:hypothetical protein
MPSTPRSESVQSFRLSDEESSVAWETGSQAIQSSNGDEDDKVSELDLSQEREPQLVMPSISMPVEGVIERETQKSEVIAAMQQKTQQWRATQRRPPDGAVLQPEDEEDSLSSSS